MAIQWRGERLEVVDSTNRVAVERLHACWAKGGEGEESLEGLFITADRQSSGRGQHGRKWESPEGGLYMSVIVEDVPVEARTILPLVAGVAVISAPRIEDHQTALRWPNDMMLDGKKVGGVLCESVAQGSRWACVMGIGVNVNTPLESFPAQVRSTATSLHVHSDKPRVGELVLAGILFALDHWVTAIKSQGVASVITYAREVDFLVGKQVEFHIDDRQVIGKACGISDSGGLLIRHEGEMEDFARGTIFAVDGVPIRRK